MGGACTHQIGLCSSHRSVTYFDTATVLMDYAAQTAEVDTSKHAISCFGF